MKNSDRPSIPLGRRQFLATAVGLVAQGRLSHADGAAPGSRPRPSPSQLTWQQDERALFVHLGMNTFTDREWGDGREHPAAFAPRRLDVAQWARAARASGFRAMILTAKHHDGFCLWPSRTTSHTVAQSRWRSGDGDVVREFTDACRAQSLRVGLYCSPWDRHEPSYGDSPRYNDLYCDQLTELLAQYGPIHEVWFDGANGEGPDGRRQAYDWPRFFGLVRRLQPAAVIFSDAGPDIRWIGNERGTAGDPNWSTVQPERVPSPGASGEGIIEALQHGDVDGTVWRPGEADVSIRPGWFYHASEDAAVKTADELVDLFFASVGRNSKLLLNVPPTPDGLFHPTDIGRLAALDERLRASLTQDMAAGRGSWRRTGPRTAVVDVAFDRATHVGVIDLREDIARGQAVARYTIEAFGDGGWRVLARGTTIGYRKLDRVASAPVRRLRVVVEDAIRTPDPIHVRVYERSRP